MRTVDLLYRVLVRLPIDRLTVHPDDLVELRKECQGLQATPQIGEYRFNGVLLVQDGDVPRLSEMASA